MSALLMRCLLCGTRLFKPRSSLWKNVGAQPQSERLLSSLSIYKQFHKPGLTLFLFLIFYCISFTDSGENDSTDGYVVTPNTAQLLAKHLQETGGNVSAF